VVDRLYTNNVAYSFPHKEFLYFKGKTNETVNQIRRDFNELLEDKLFMGNQIEEYKLSYNTQIILKPIVYMAFEKLLETIGFFIPKKTVKRSLPLIDTPLDDDFIIQLNEDIFILRGIKYMLEIRPSGRALLWLDIYSPAYNISEKRRISPREIREAGLMDHYYELATLKPKDRYDLICKVLDMICQEQETLKLNFPDGDFILFEKKLLYLEIPEIGG